jgi:hypothetical protein
MICKGIAMDFDSFILKSFIELLKIIPTAIIGGIAVYIAYQQWQTSHKQLKINLFDRRLNAYLAVVEFLRIASGDAENVPQLVIKLAGDTLSSSFLFGPDISAYIDEIIQRSLKIHAYNLTAWQHNAVETYTAEQKQKDQAWLADQIISKIIVKKFQKYLALEGIDK